MELLYPFPEAVSGKFPLVYFISCAIFTIYFDLNCNKGSFTNYMTSFWGFFDHLPPFVDSFYLIKVDIF